MLYDRLVEAIDTGDTPDYIDPGKKRKIEQGELGYEDILPTAEYTHALSSSEYKKAVRKLEQYSGQTVNQNSSFPILQGMMSTVREIAEIESDHTDFLEALAIDTVINLPEFAFAKDAYDAGEIKIDATLLPGMVLPAKNEDIDEVEDVEDIEELDDAPEELDDIEEDLAFELADMNQEKMKRRFANLIIQGTAVSKMDLWQMLRDELEDLHPDLMTKYGVVTSSGQIMYWLMPEMEMSGGEAGDEEVDIEEDGTGVIRARAVNFPLLMHELVKGLAEYVSIAGLSDNDSVAAEVIRDVDTSDNEVYDIMLGAGFWQKVVDAIGDHDQKYVYSVFAKLLEHPAVDPDVPESFAATIKAFLSSPERAREMVNTFVRDIEAAIDDYDAPEPWVDSDEAYSDVDVYSDPDISPEDYEGLDDFLDGLGEEF